MPSTTRNPWRARETGPSCLVVSLSAPKTASPPSRRTTRSIPRDKSRVQLDERAEIRYWMAKFNVSEERLIEAVQAAGPWIEDVGIHLLRLDVDKMPACHDQ
jgi:hypothetical protein